MSRPIRSLTVVYEDGTSAQFDGSGTVRTTTMDDDPTPVETRCRFVTAVLDLRLSQPPLPAAVVSLQAASEQALREVIAQWWSDPDNPPIAAAQIAREMRPDLFT